MCHRCHLVPLDMSRCRTPLTCCVVTTCQADMSSAAQNGASIFRPSEPLCANRLYVQTATLLGAVSVWSARPPAVASAEHVRQPSAAPEGEPTSCRP